MGYLSFQLGNLHDESMHGWAERLLLLSVSTAFVTVRRRIYILCSLTLFVSISVSFQRVYSTQITRAGILYFYTYSLLSVWGRVRQVYVSKVNRNEDGKRIWQAE